MSGWVNGDFFRAEQRPLLIPPPSPGCALKEASQAHDTSNAAIRDKDIKEPRQDYPLCDGSGKDVSAMFVRPFPVAHKTC